MKATRSKPRSALGDLTTLISSGSTPRGGSEIYLREGPVMLIRSQNVHMNQLVLDDVAFITDEIDAGMNRSRVQCGDVLLNITGASIGRVAAFELDGVRANVNQHVCIIRPKPAALCSRYLTHLICSSSFQAEIDRLQHGGTRQALTFGQIADFSIPLPPLPEQHRIADILDRAESLQAKRRAALAKLDTLTQAIFMEMFGDPMRNEKGWPVKTLGSHSSKIGSGATPTGGDTAYKESGISLIRSLNVRDGEFTFKDLAHIDDEQAARLSNVVVNEGDVLLNITGASVARVCRAPASVLPARVNQHVTIIRPTASLLPHYLEQTLLNASTKHTLLRIAESGATRQAITKAQIEEFGIPVPPLPLQQEFARSVAAVEQLRSTHRASLAQLDALFASLQHRAFRGEL